MTENKNELFEWHLAYLRQNAQDFKSPNMTPMSLIHRDRKLVDRLVAEAAEKQAASRAASDEERGILDNGFADMPGQAAFLLISVVCVLGYMTQTLVMLLLVLPLILLLILILSRRSGLTDRAKISDPNLRSVLLQRHSVANPFKRLADCSFKELVSELLQRITVLEQKERLIFDYCNLVLCELNEDGKIVRLNENAQSIWYYTTAEISGAALADLMSADSKLLFETTLKRSRAEREAVEQEFRLRRRDGEIIDLQLRIEWSAKANAYFCRGENITEQKNAERLKAEVTAMINHDLRAPVTSFYYALNNMLDGKYGEPSEPMEETLELCLRNMRSVLSLLDNLTNAQKLESGELRAKLVQVQVQDFFDDIGELLREWCKAANLTLLVEETDARVHADADQCLRILGNLCANAIKWSPAGSTIHLRARTDSGFVIIEVEDSGPGINTEAQELLFQRWGSGASAQSQLSPSAGLGLYIAKKFTELQGGQIGVKSEPGKGSTFWFSLPV